MSATAGIRLLTDGETAKDTNLLVLSVGVLLLFGIQVLQRCWSERFALSYVNDLRLVFMSHVLRATADEKSMRYGLVMTRVTNDFSAVKLWLSDGLVAFLVALSVCATIFAYLFFAIPEAAAAFGFGIAVWLALGLMCFIPLNRAIRKARRARGRVASRASILLNGRLAFLTHGRTGASLRAIERRSNELSHALVQRATFSGILRSSSGFVFPIVVVALAFGISSVNSFSFDPGQLGVFIMALGLAVSQLAIAARAADYLLASRIALRRLKTILARPAIALSDKDKRLQRTGMGRDLEVRGLTIDDQQMPVSFSARAGEIVSIPDLPPETASGFLKTIAGLAKPTGGAVLLDGLALEDVKRRDWLRAVSYVSPAIPLVAGTVLQNIKLGAASSVSDEEYHCLFHRFALGTETLSCVIREDTKLDRQMALKVRLLRALVRRPSLVLVDDPDLVDHPPILSTFLAELERRGITGIVIDELSSGLPKARPTF
ncbi:ABC transporter ATP-binding protein [Labrenzia sp. R4_1]|uniref:ABC transporter transmembrane domain-containing protein n=1 Tax=Labrenzia sp. R4_1 TaxID=2821106 RepID=UPI001ADC7CDE|nr:ABC transporter ATP-binding protein [Labrenzia sp. R4_1]